jgi:hypothetical protein
MQDTGYLNGCRYLLHDRDKKFGREFREALAASGVKCTPIPARSPNLNAHAERWVRSIKEECLSKLILLGEKCMNIFGQTGTRTGCGKGDFLLARANADLRRGPSAPSERSSGIAR